MADTSSILQARLEEAHSFSCNYGYMLVVNASGIGIYRGMCWIKGVSYSELIEAKVNPLLLIMKELQTIKVKPEHLTTEYR